MTSNTNTKEQLSKGRKDDTSTISSSLQQSLQDKSINTALIATQPNERSLCDSGADDESKGAFEQGEEINLMLSATKDSIVCCFISLRNQGLDSLLTQMHLRQMSKTKDPGNHARRGQGEALVAEILVRPDQY